MQLITHYFERDLERLGYAGTEVRYSLGYSQGDGMAFYGYPDAPDRLVERLLHGPCRAGARRALAKGGCVRIDRNGYGWHYSHWNTMAVTVDGGAGLTRFEEDALVALEAAIQADVRTQSRRLEREGYALIEGGLFEARVVREFRTRRFTLRITEVPDDDFDLCQWDEALVDGFYAGLLAGHYRYFGVTVELFAGGLLLGHDSLWGITDETARTDRSYGGYRRDLVKAAVDEARAALRKLCMSQVA